MGDVPHSIVVLDTGKLTRLNVIFDRAADKNTGGVREDKLASLLPLAFCDHDQAISVGYKYGLNPVLLNRKTSISRRMRRGPLKKEDMRVITRGPFISMFAGTKDIL